MEMLSVPLRYQQKGSKDCSIISTQMVLAYLGDERSYFDLKSQFSEYINEEQIDFEGIPILLSKEGYHVVFMHHDLGVVDKYTDYVTEKDIVRLEKRVQALSNDDKTVYQRRKLNLGIMCIKAGVEYKHALPSLRSIDQYLDAGYPVIIGIRQKGWRSMPYNEGNHYVVVTGKGDNHYTINDPLQDFSGPILH